MKAENIKPIPKYIRERIRKLDLKYCPEQKGRTRFYSYLTKNSGELVKVTVAVITRYKTWFCKQVAIRGIDSTQCLVKDMEFHYIAGYQVGWHAEGASKHKAYYEDGKWYTAIDGYYNPFAHPVNNEFIGKIPEFKYSAYADYNGDCIIRYLREYRKHPILEMLVKHKLSRFLYSKQIVNKCEKDRAFRRWLIKNAQAATDGKIYISALLKAYKEKIDIKTAQSLEILKKELASGAFEPIKAIVGADIAKYKNYLIKQNASNRQYLDYVVACNYLGIDMTQPKNLYPKDFRRWHDIRADEYRTARALKDAEERKEYYEKFAAVAEKYLPLQKAGKGDYLIVIAKSPAELVREGDILSHCVGRMNYDQKMAREETLIFFVRKKDAPEVPFVTLEYSLSKKVILQCYGDHDSRPPKEVSSFVNRWLPYANRKLERIAA